MTLAAESAKARKDLAWLLEIEVAKRIDALVWALATSGSPAYYITPTEGEPGRVREIDRTSHAITEYSEEASLAACQAAAGSWFFDTATGRLYVNTTGGTDPSGGDYYVAAYYWKLYCDGQHPAPKELVFNGAWYDPKLDKASLPVLAMEVSGFHEGGVRQTWGALKLLNGDGSLDQELVDYIWENKVFILKVGVPGDAYAQFVTAARGRTGSITWSLDEGTVTIGLQDPLRAED